MCHCSSQSTSFSFLFYSTLFFFFFFFFFNDTATTEIYTLSLHDALPISTSTGSTATAQARPGYRLWTSSRRSEEHTSELQSRLHLVCRLLLENKHGVTSRPAACRPRLARMPDHTRSRTSAVKRAASFSVP